MRKWVSALFIIFGAALLLAVESDIEKIIETLNSSVTNLNRRITALYGYFEGKLTDLETEVYDKLNYYDKRFDVNEKAIIAIQKTLENLNATLENFYQNEVLLADSLKVLKEELLNLKSENALINKRLETYEKEQESNKWLIYGSLLLSVANTLGIILILILGK